MADGKENTMKVKELIEQLKTVDGNLEVVIATETDLTCRVSVYTSTPNWFDGLDDEHIDVETKADGKILVLDIY